VNQRDARLPTRNVNRSADEIQRTVGGGQYVGDEVGIVAALIDRNHVHAGGEDAKIRIKVAVQSERRGACQAAGKKKRIAGQHGRLRRCSG
jgi:hypothetical protein